MSPLFRRRGAPPPPDEPPPPPPADDGVTRVVAPPPDAWVEEREEVVEERPPRRDGPLLWPWLLLLLLLVLGGLGALWWYQHRDDGKTTVPDVTRVQEAEAVRRVEEAGLDAIVERHPNAAKAGLVYAQRPGGGSQVDDGQGVVLQVSQGPATATVPNVVGLPVAEARDRLEQTPKAKWKLVERKVFSEEPDGVVVAQDPKAGAEVSSAATVHVNVSKGTGRVPVPELVGKTKDEAVAALKKAGLAASAFDVPSSEPKGTVIAQNPLAGTQAAKGDKVRINVSTGEGSSGGTTSTTGTGGTDGGTTTTSGGGAATAPVPDVTGSRLGAAQRELQSAGFVVTYGYVSSPKPAGVVVSQSPAGGGTAKVGSKVALKVSRGPASKPLKAVPDVTGLDEAAARSELRAAGFTVAVFTEPTPDPAEVGTVIRQEPGAAQKAPAGSLVTIYVGESTA